MSFEYDIPKCQHIRTNGTHCKSAALKGAQLCYHHERDRARLENLHQARALKGTDYMNGYPKLQETINPEILESLQIPALDDAASIQVALTNLVRAICYEHISEKRAGLALYGVQIATITLAAARLAASADEDIALEDPSPIRPFWKGPGYKEHLARRGQSMLKQQELEEGRLDEDAAQNKKYLDSALASAKRGF